MSTTRVCLTTAAKQRGGEWRDITRTERMEEFGDAVPAVSSAWNDYELERCRVSLPQTPTEGYSVIPYDKQKVMVVLCDVTPFCFLSKHARTKLAEASELRAYKGGEVICRPAWDTHDTGAHFEKDDGSTFIVVEGKVAGVQDNHFYELIPKNSMFGLDFAVLDHRRKITRIADGDCTVLAMRVDAVRDAIKETMEARVSITRTFTEKVNIGAALSAFKSTVRDGVRCGRIALPELLERYKRIRPVLHPHVLDEGTLDTGAWKYAVERLPKSLTKTYVFFIMKRLPEWLGDSWLLEEVHTKRRQHAAYCLDQGKTAVILRDFESDMLDFMANLCMHCIEARKLRKRLLAHPRWLALLRESGCSLESITPLTEKDRDGLEAVWGRDQACAKILEVIYHHEDYQVALLDTRTIAPDPSERWTRQLWHEARKVLCLSSDIMAPGDLCDCDLVVDMLQGSTRTMMNLFAAHIHGQREKILRWGEQQRLKINFLTETDNLYAETDNSYAETDKMYAETDKLYAYAHHYFERNSIDKADLTQGIVKLDHTEYTGVTVMLVNVSAIKRDRVDPALSNICAAATHHLLVNIGYPFGRQSAEIIRGLILLFGKKIRSMNIIGKAGGIKRDAQIGDVLIASDVVNDDPHGIVQLSPHGVDSFFSCPVHIGRMLTAAGTILQNYSVLRFYRNILGCIGVEMEAYHFATEIIRGKEAGLLDSEIAQRFLYFVSDLPLQTGMTLATERDSFDEGVPALTACFRACFRCMFKPRASL